MCSIQEYTAMTTDHYYLLHVLLVRREGFEPPTKGL